MNDTRTFKINRRQGRIYLKFSEAGQEIAVRAAYLRPLTGFGKEISFIDDAKKEVAMVKSLDILDTASRELVAHELDNAYLKPCIVSVYSAIAEYGVVYLDVETSEGRRRFTLREPFKNVTRVSDDHLIMRDTIGNRYEIPSVSALGTKSRRELEKVL